MAYGRETVNAMLLLRMRENEQRADALYYATRNGQRSTRNNFPFLKFLAILACLMLVA